jgi:anti-sigma B factor antagonist
MDADDVRRVQPVPLGLVTSAIGQGMVRLAVDGEVDVATVAPLRDVLTALAGDRRVRRLVVDLAEVGFLGSAGVSTLVGAQRLAQANQIEFVLVNCRPRTLRVLEITGVHKLFNTRTDVPQTFER